MGRHSWKIRVIIGEVRRCESLQALAFHPKPKSTRPEEEANLSSSLAAQSVRTARELPRPRSLVRRALRGWGMRSVSLLKSQLLVWKIQSARCDQLRQSE